MNENAIRARAVALLEKAKKLVESGERDVGDSSELLNGTISLVGTLYGENSHHMRTLLGAIEDKGGGKGLSVRMQWIPDVVAGTLQNLLAELDAGLLGSLQRHLAGEMLADFLSLARAALEEHQEGANNVAAVLVAAAFEDVIRRMGSLLAGVSDRPELHVVLQRLKDQNVLVATQFTLAQSLLPFRNRALHADFQKIEREATIAALAFVEALLLRHFA